MKAEISALQAAAAGGMAGAITRAVAHPLDVLKIRFQLQLEPLKSGSKYYSMHQAIKSIVKEEGLLTLWSGHVPAQCLSISYGLIQFSTFEKLIELNRTNHPERFQQYRHRVNFMSGALAATVATIISFPFDTVRTRLVAEEKTKKAYKGFSNALVTMVKTEGPSSLFKGLVPTLGQIAPHAGVQFAVYKFFTENIFAQVAFFQRDTSNNSTSTPNNVELSTLGNLISGSIAGLVAKTVIYPFDLLKKRLQIQGFQKHRMSFGKQMYCRGLLHCVYLTVKMEGVLALYKGFGPSIVKAVFVSAMYFGVYD